MALLVAAVAGAGLTSCSIEASKKKDLLERIQPPQPVLAATGIYGGGVLTVGSWLGSTVRLKKPAANAGITEVSAPNGPRRPEAGRTRPPVEAEDPFTRGGTDYTPQEVDELYGHVNFEHMVPPRMALTFKFTNAGTQPITFTIVDVNSPLGNFAPRPETLTVAPGQTGTIDPMLSNLDANFEELDVTLTLGIAGGRETQILKLRRTPEAAAEPGQK
jgi:hypothetical protein